jgi:hypothetical protein
MSTRSRIGIANADKTITSIYCQSDGYLSWTGVRLLASYTTEEKVRELLALGELRIVGYEIGEKHVQAYPAVNDWCIAYGRDLSAANAGSGETTSYKRFLDLREEYTYLFEHNQWRVMHDGPTWKRLDLEILADRITS